MVFRTPEWGAGGAGEARIDAGSAYPRGRRARHMVHKRFAEREFEGKLPGPPAGPIAGGLAPDGARD